MTTTRRDIPMIGIREFRDSFQNIKQPVKVIRSRKPYIEIIGTWTPNPKRSDLEAQSPSE